VSPIVDMQQRFQELGRIRIGIQVEYEKDGKKRSRPEKLETFRLTSPNRDLLEAAVIAYGDAEIRPWQGQWEVVTPSRSSTSSSRPGSGSASGTSSGAPAAASGGATASRTRSTRRPARAPRTPRSP
jgi:hypothetical protein